MTETKTRWGLILLLYAAGLLAAGQFAKIALELLSLETVYPEAPVALLVSALSVAGILFGVTSGVVVARMGAGRSLLAALLAAGALTAAQATLPPFAVMMALRLAEGLAHLTIVVAAPALMVQAASGRDVPVAMGLWGTFFGVGFALSAAIGPWLDTVPATLLAHAGACLVIAAMLFPLLQTGPGQAQDRIGFLRRHASIYGTPAIVAPALGFFLHTAMFLGLLTFVPLTVTPDIAALMPLLALVGTFGAGVIARYRRPETILLVAFLLSVVAGLVLMVLPEELRAIGTLVFIVIVGLVPGASFADVPALNRTPETQAQAYGAIAQLGNVGTAVSVPLFALMLPLAGFPALIGLAALISAMGCLAVWIIHRKIAEPA